MNLKNLKIDLPKTWRETSHTGNEKQIIIHVYHVNPLAHIDPKRFQYQAMPSRGPEISVTKLGIQAPGRGLRPMEEFYKGMKALIASGIMPPAVMTMGKLEKWWKEFTKSPQAERPGESDVASDIDITQYQDEETAWQTLKNKGQMPTRGFNVPIPGGITIPGMSKNMTMSDLLQSDMLKNYIPKEQLGKLEKMQSAIKGVQAKMPKIRQDLEKKGVKYGEGKYLGCKTVYLESPNPTPPPASKSASSSRSNVSGMGMGGKNVDAFGKREGHIAHLDPLPKVAEPYAATKIMYLGLLFKNFIIGGPLLWGVDSLAPGNTPCYSLTKTKEVISTDRVGGKIFKDITIVPLPSTFAQEGYLNREEVEKIFRDIISKLG